MASDVSFLNWLTEMSTGNYIAIASVVSVGLGIALLRQLVSGGRCQSEARLDGKFVIITGANTGIGKETAKQLCMRGARVIMACRDPLKGAAAADDLYKTSGQRIMVKTLDLSDLNSVRQFARDINNEEPRLDVLINNAGVMACPRQESKQGFELQFATNHLGAFLLTNLLKDLMVRSAPSRIINVSGLIYTRGKISFDDIHGTKHYNPYGAYAQSKLANILFTNELAKRLKGTGVTVNALHPGVIASDLGRHIESRIPLALQIIVNPLIYLVKFLVFKTVQQGAQTSIYCAVSEELEGVSGKYFSDCTETKLLPNALDEDAARRLWDMSEEMVGLNPRKDNSDETKPEVSTDMPDIDQTISKTEETDEDSTESFAQSGSRQTTV